MGNVYTPVLLLLNKCISDSSLSTKFVYIFGSFAYNFKDVKGNVYKPGKSFDRSSEFTSEASLVHQPSEFLSWILTNILLK